MNASKMTDRQLLEQIAIDVGTLKGDVKLLKAGQESLNKKIDFVTQHTSDQFVALQTTLAEHTKTLSEQTGTLAEIRIDVKRLDEERIVMVERQNRFEQLHR